ncbi:MAG: protein kinase [bacterium]|nr:protein kinase [bacterium]
MKTKKSIGNMTTIHNERLKMPEVPDLLIPGSEICGYKVIKFLGLGSMGQVYLVKNIQMHKLYALKILPKSLSDNVKFIDRFKIEARVMADLKHPNIVKVHNIGHDKELGLYYLVMEYVSSINNEKENSPSTNNHQPTTNPPDLEQLLKKKKKLPEDYVLKVTKQLCSALEYAHNFRGKGIIHRDLKPSNILLDADGNALIADFGLAKVIGQDYLKSMIDCSTQLTMANNDVPSNMSLSDMSTIVEDTSSLSTNNHQPSTNATTGSLIGTFEYMAPEQQDGDVVTIQSDIYSLGLIIYRMISGVKAKGRFDMPSKLGYSKKWNKIIDKCLKRNPADRFNSTKDILKILNKKKSYFYIVITIIGAVIVFFAIYTNTSSVRTKNIEVKKTKEKQQVQDTILEKSIDKHANNVVVQNNNSDINPIQKLNKENTETEQDIAEKTPEDYYQQGKDYYLNKNYSMAFELLKKSSESENSDAQYLLAQMYYFGEGTGKNPDQAVNYYKKAAAKGHHSAQAQLGWLYYIGDGTKKDYEKSIYWLKKAADANIATAQNNLGYMYQHGYGVKLPSLYQAVKWYKRSADNGDTKAMVNLSKYYFDRKEYSVAFSLIKRAAEKGNTDAQLNLGILYQKGLGTGENLAKAKYWYEQAAKNGNQKAEKNLYSLKKL